MYTDLIAERMQIEETLDKYRKGKGTDDGGIAEGLQVGKDLAIKYRASIVMNVADRLKLQLEQVKTEIKKHEELQSISDNWDILLDL